MLLVLVEGHAPGDLLGSGVDLDRSRQAPDGVEQLPRDRAHVAAARQGNTRSASPAVLHHCLVLMQIERRNEGS